MIGGFVRNNLSYSKAIPVSSDQEKCSEALSSLKNSSPFSPRCDIESESSHAPYELLYILYAGWPLHIGDGEDLVGVGFDTAGTDDVA